jgi:TolB protein
MNLKMNAFRTKVTRVTLAVLLMVFFGLTGSALALFWFADDTLIDERLLYFIAGKTFFSNVYIQFPNGDLKNISPSKEGIYYQADINRDGTQVVFFGNDTGSPRVWRYDFSKESPVPITPKEVNARHPVFSYDGKHIAFSADFGIDQERERMEFMHRSGKPPKNLTFNIFTMDTEGGNRKQITFGQYQDQRPAFSPDGKKLAFISNRSGENRIWIVSSDGSSKPRPLQMSGHGYRPRFSLDGKKIYFFTGTNRRNQICVLDLDSKKIIPLKNDDKGFSHGPFADYNQKVLLMHSNRSGKWQLFELPLNGGPPRSIQPSQFEEALHATRSINGILAFDVPKISGVRKLAAEGLRLTKSLKMAF